MRFQWGEFLSSEQGSYATVHCPLAHAACQPPMLKAPLPCKPVQVRAGAARPDSFHRQQQDQRDAKRKRDTLTLLQFLAEGCAEHNAE